MKRTTRNLILREAKKIVENENATIDDLIKVCTFATEDEVFEVISGSKYSTLYNSRGDR